MHGLWMYRTLSRLPFNYRFKILVVAFVGTHVPLIGLSLFFGLRADATWGAFAVTLGVTLVATLAGTAITLLALNGLLEPVLRTSRALRAYRESRAIAELPSSYHDEVGTLMADAGATLAHLEAVRDRLENNDEATGLPNRHRLSSIIAARIEAGAPFGIAVLRVANIARVVQALDASQVERAMATLADRLQADGAGRGVLARIAPDKFALLTPLVGDAAAALIASLCNSCRGDLELAGLTIRPAVFAGIAEAPDDGVTADELLDNAVSAAFAASPSRSVNRYVAADRGAAISRLRVEEELRRALHGDEFRLFYQPVVDLGQSAVRGAEALIRWQHPSRGLVPPGQFVPIAEACGLMDPIGLWVIRDACRQIGVWNREGRGELKVAVNVSARQFLDPDLTMHLREALETAGVQPNQLEVELTETAAMTDQDHTRRVFTALRDLGVTIAIDDFGTGYASISYLRRLPFDKLKIDREFVTDVHKNRHGQAICGALVTLCRGLGLEVLAEGTEAAEEVLHLKEIGCDLFQGYYFAKPLPAHEYGPAIDMLSRHVLLTPGTFGPLFAPAGSSPERFALAG